MSAPRILTTVVGSYPVPEWLAAAPSEQALLDATRVVIHIQEHAGIDLVADGELYRFDVSHPETNGMIEYFVRPLAGVRPDIGFSEWMAYARGAATRFRTRPPGVVEGPIGAGSLNLPLACARARALATRPFKFTLTGPHMLAKMLHDRYYRDAEKLAHAIADVLAEQVASVDADVIQVDEANLPGHPEEWQWAAATINKVLQAVPSKSKAAVHLCFGNYGGQTIQKGSWAKLMDYLNALRADHIVMETAHRPPEELGVFKDLRPQIGFGLGVVDIKRTEVESPTRSPAPSSAPTRCSARCACDTSMPTAASGCSSATWPTARRGLWSRDATCTRAVPEFGKNENRGLTPSIF